MASGLTGGHLLPMNRRPVAPAWLVVAALLLALLPAAPIDAKVAWQPPMDRAKAYARQRSGSVSFAVVDPSGRIWGHRRRTSVPAASVMKVMFLAAYLRHPSVRDRPLRDSDRDLLRPMIVRSDNVTASRIADFVGPKRMNRLAARAGMRDFSYTRPWGMSRTSARDQAWFLFRLRRYIPNRHEAYALKLLSRITDEQRWGVGQVDTPGWSKHFKGGWGSGSGAVDHQVVRLERTGGARIGAAVMTTGNPSHDYGKRTLEGVFGRLLVGLP